MCCGGLLFGGLQLEEILQEQLPESHRSDLLGASVRITGKRVEMTREVHTGDRRQFEVGLVGTGHSWQWKAFLPGSPSLEEGALFGGDRRMGVPDVKGDQCHGALPACGSRHLYRGRSRGGCGFQLKPCGLFPRAGEGEHAAFLSHGSEQVAGFHPDRDLMGILPEGEDFRCQGNLLSRAGHAWQGGQHHHRRSDREAFLRGAVSPVLARDHHGPDRPHIVGHPEGMAPAATPQGKGPRKKHHRRKTVGLLMAGSPHLLVPTHGKGLLKLRPVSPGHIIIEVVTLYTQGFPGIEMGVRIRGAETGEVQQSLVYDGDRVSHPPARFLPDRQRELFFRPEFRVGRNHRFQKCGGVFDGHGPHPVKPDGGVVARRSVWLEQGHMQIKCRSHTRLHFHLKRSLLVGGLHPEDLPDLPPVFEADQCPGPCHRRKGDLYFFSRGILLLIGAEGQHGRPIGHGVCPPIPPFRHVKGDPRSMAALRIPGVEQVPPVIAPVAVVYFQFQLFPEGSTVQ